MGSLKQEKEKLTKEEKVIIKLMNRDQPTSFEEIIERTGIKLGVVSSTLDNLIKKGIIKETHEKKYKRNKS